MGYLIDFSNFIYNCVYIDNEDCKFTYISNFKIPNFIINDFINILKKISLNEKFINSLLTNKNLADKFHFHMIKPLTLKIRIAHLFKNYKNQDWLSQIILESNNIYQIKIQDVKRRLFFILDKKDKKIIPLFLDLNHLINFNEKKAKNNKYKKCLICNKSCTENPFNLKK